MMSYQNAGKYLQTEGGGTMVRGRIVSRRMSARLCSTNSTERDVEMKIFLFYTLLVFNTVDLSCMGYEVGIMFLDAY